MTTYVPLNGLNLRLLFVHRPYNIIICTSPENRPIAVYRVRKFNPAELCIYIPILQGINRCAALSGD